MGSRRYTIVKPKSFNSWFWHPWLRNLTLKYDIWDRTPHLYHSDIHKQGMGWLRNFRVITDDLFQYTWMRMSYLWWVYSNIEIISALRCDNTVHRCLRVWDFALSHEIRRREPNPYLSNFGIDTEGNYGMVEELSSGSWEWIIWVWLGVYKLFEMSSSM